MPLKSFRNIYYKREGGLLIDMLKLITWNVNGLRACLKKGFEGFFSSINADIFSIQETKLQEGQTDFSPGGYYDYWNHALKKGYSGTAVFTKKKPIKVMYGIGIDNHDTEGRAITLEFDNFYLVNIYTPNARRELERLDYRMVWEDDLRKYLKILDHEKPVIICGDLNVAHKEIDLKNPAANRGNAGFTDEERQKFSELLEAGFVDAFRYLYPDRQNAYTWWSYMGNARNKNIGWRIDYFCVSQKIADKIKDVVIHDKIMGSDHCPVEMIIDI